MHIEAEGFKLEMSVNELWQIAEYIRQSLMFDLKERWIDNQLKWEMYETNRLSILGEMYQKLARMDRYYYIFKEAEEIFNTHNELEEIFKKQDKNE